MKKFLKKYGLINRIGPIRAYWWSGENNLNFGDIVTPYLIKKITGKEPLLCNRHCFSEYFLMTGSVIEHANRNAVVWGTGMMYRDQKIKKPKKIHAVRGPITRERILEHGYECPEVYGDPALLLPRFYTPQIEKKYKIGLIPHYVDYSEMRQRVDSEKALVINLLNPVETVVDMILSCKTTISSSLHGIIVSQTYGIPSVWAEFSKKLSGDGTKFKDYFLSVGIEPYQGIDMSGNDLVYKNLEDCSTKASSLLKIDLDALYESCPLDGRY